MYMLDGWASGAKGGGCGSVADASDDTHMQVTNQPASSSMGALRGGAGVICTVLPYEILLTIVASVHKATVVCEQGRCRAAGWVTGRLGSDMSPSS
jgi:hypothetical protein